MLLRCDPLQVYAMPQRKEATVKVISGSTGGEGYSIMRPTIYGNPFKIGVHGTRAEVVLKYKHYFWARINSDAEFLARVLDLEGHDLMCCCAPMACHGDVIVAWFDAGCPLKGGAS